MSDQGFLPNIPASLRASFKKLTQGTLPDMIKARFHDGFYFQFDPKSSFKQRVYVSEGTNQQLLLVAYSPSSKIQSDILDMEKLLVQARRLNTDEHRTVFIIGEEHGSSYFFLEMTLFPAPAESLDSELILKGCQVIHEIYNLHAEKFLCNPRLDSDSMKKIVEGVLTEYYKNIKKPQEGDAIYSYQVFLKNKTSFILAIEVTAKINVHISWTNCGTVHSVKSEHKPFYEKLISALNTQVLDGSAKYVLTDDSNVKLMLQIDAEDSHTYAETCESLERYYENAVDLYEQTVPALSRFYEDMVEDSFSEAEIDEHLIEYIALADPKQKLQDYSYQEELFETDKELLRILKEDKSLLPYTLPIQYKVCERLKKLTINFDPSLIPLPECFRIHPTTRKQLSYQIQNLHNALLPLQIFPTHNMLFCRPPSFSLVLIPGQGLHRDVHQFEADFSHIRYEIEYLEQGQNDYLWISSADFEYQESIDGIITRVRRGKEKYALYPVSTAVTPDWQRGLGEYNSKLYQLAKYQNHIIGWTFIMEDGSQSFQVVEQYICEIFQGTWSESLFTELLELVKRLHSAKFVHWFISPFTIREHPEKKKLALVLPCLDRTNLECVSSFIPKKYQEFIAPEVIEAIHHGSEVEDVWKADVYSLCKLMKKHIPPSLVPLVQAGLQEDPRQRPMIESFFQSLGL